MNGLTRRDLGRQSVALLPSLAWAQAEDPPLVSSAAAFRNGGRKGFVLGGVERDVLLIDAMSRLGANTARVFFPFRRCRDCDRFGRAAGDQAALRGLLAQAAARGIRLVVVGSFDGIEAPAFWRNAALRDSVVENWEWFAATFGDDPAIAGLDLMNEPNPPWPSGDIAQAQADWNPLAEQAIAAIRRRRPAMPIVFEPVAGGNVLGLLGMRPFADPEIVYSIHFYTPHDITHQGVGSEWNVRIPYPAGTEFGLGRWSPTLGVTRIDAHRLERELDVAREFQLRHDVPIYVGEFSCVRWAPEGSARRWVRDALALFERFGWSWTYHEFRGWPGWDAEIDSVDPTSTRRSDTAPVMASLRAAMQRRPT